MAKFSLQDVKKKNRSAVLKTLLNEDGLSRIELAGETKLSPSTVSSLVSELLEEGVLLETGSGVSTGGRKRIALDINPDYGCVAVVEVRRQGVEMRVFDMQLHQQAGIALCGGDVSGNEVLDAVIRGMARCREIPSLAESRLRGIGLLFQEDMTPKDYSVVYSTSLSSACISLKDAMSTHFKLPVVEDYLGAYTMRAEELPPGERNSAYVTVGKSVLARVAVDGRVVEFKDGRMLDLSPLMKDMTAPSELTGIPDFAALTRPGVSDRVLRAALWPFISVLMALSMFFPVDTIYLGCKRAELLTGTVQRLLAERLAPVKAPQVAAAGEEEPGGAGVLAAAIRRQVLCG